MVTPSLPYKNTDIYNQTSELLDALGGGSTGLLQQIADNTADIIPIVQSIYGATNQTNVGLLDVNGDGNPWLYHIQTILLDSVVPGLINPITSDPWLLDISNLLTNIQSSTALIESHTQYLSYTNANSHIVSFENTTRPLITGDIAAWINANPTLRILTTSVTQEASSAKFFAWITYTS